MGRPLAAVGGLFLLSGATALGLEVLWERELRLVLGVSTWSVAIVTAAFMGGLAIGYWSGHLSFLRRFHPLRIYAACEAAIGLYALAVPAILPVVDVVHQATGGHLAGRAITALAILVPPAFLMGLSLPPLVRRLVTAGGPGTTAAVLYAANTLGGVVGAVATSWFWIRLFGAGSTTTALALTNLGVALLAFSLSTVVTARRAEATPSAVTPARAPLVIVLGALLAGFQLMGLQVVWNRTLVCAVESHTTSFALILATVLLGSAAGAAAYPVVGRRVTSPSGRLLLFVGVEVALCVFTAGSIALVNGLYEVGRSLTAVFPIRSIEGLLLVRFLVAAGPVVPAAALGAFLVPLLVDLAGDGGDPARPVSIVFAADALGSVAGALVAGFIAIPVFGLGDSLTGLAHLAAGTAALVALGCARSPALRVAGVVVALVAIGVSLGLRSPLTVTRWYDGHQKIEGELLHYREGTFGTLSVFQMGERREMLINCIEEVPNHRDAVLLFKLLGHAPLLFHADPDDVLVNAVGGGITLGAVTRHPVTVEAVELVPEVLEALPFFAEENGNVLERENWTFVADDGRHHLRTSERRWDVVTADATHPAAGESWPLYTREYYGTVRRHLRTDGVFAQWLPLHNLVSEDFRSVIRTFAAEFPETLLFFVNRYAMLVGAEDTLDLDSWTIGERLESRPEVAGDLASFGIEGGAGILRYLVLDREGVDRLAGDAPILADDRATIEFAELRRIGTADTFPQNLALLVERLDPNALARRTGLDPAVFEARRFLARARLRSREPTLESAFGAVLDLERARALAPDDPDVEEPLTTVQDAIVRHIHADYEAILGRSDLPRIVDILEYARIVRPEDPLLHEVAGVALLRLERFADAVGPLEEAAALRPGSFPFLSNLAFVYEQVGRTDLALEIVERLETMDPSNPALAAVRDRLEAREEGR